jgi:hypothetical protein
VIDTSELIEIENLEIEKVVKKVKKSAIDNTPPRGCKPNDGG